MRYALMLFTIIAAAITRYANGQRASVAYYALFHILLLAGLPRCRYLMMLPHAGATPCRHDIVLPSAAAIAAMSRYIILPCHTLRHDAAGAALSFA